MELMRKANELLSRHPVNEQRRKEGKLPANAIWFWPRVPLLLCPTSMNSTATTAL
jgi:2,3-bisphosphoglycerate-independent phosphoglycerate mutase